MVEVGSDAYLAPRQLEVVPEALGRVQLIGGCFFDSWRWALSDLHPPERLDPIMFGHDPIGAPADCDLRIVQVPLRTLASEWATMPLGIAEEAPYARIVDAARVTLTHFVDLAVAGAPGVPTLFVNYLLPQQNTLGRLFPRRDLRNPIHLVGEFNRVLDEVVARCPGVTVLDADRVAGVFGRRFVQDDAFWLTAHGGLATDGDEPLDKDRLEPSARLSERYGHDTRGFVRMLWGEAVAMLRTIRGTDRIKMVCVDLDDTLWRGVLAERGTVDFGDAEGWPMGVAEALSILRKRGVILAIVSKNDPDFVESAFPRLFGDRLPLSSFPIRKIGWGPKPEALREAIAEANVLAEAVLFLDDNPVERARALEAIPGLRVLGGPHLDWRRILLWSPELQTPVATAESLARNDMIAAQVRREAARAAQPAGDFLADLGVAVEIGTIRASDHPRFARALELVNKTNQFNTTGRRWTQTEADRYFAKKGKWVFATARDRFTQYGLVALALVRGDRIDQMVMSCRVFGLGVEHALIAETGRAAKGRPLSGRLAHTERNGPCRTVFADLGWVREGKLWTARAAPARPAHVAVSRLSD